mmetsp:Transcript_24116/g.57017  ORF Transcript_24116/g.57017 Transcript_24116/m.57017 type:complete len:317 (-) Transcript_24116:861-1811(-)
MRLVLCRIPRINIGTAKVFRSIRSNCSLCNDLLKVKACIDHAVCCVQTMDDKCNDPHASTDKICEMTTSRYDIVSVLLWALPPFCCSVAVTAAPFPSLLLFSPSVPLFSFEVFKQTAVASLHSSNSMESHLAFCLKMSTAIASHERLSPLINFRKEEATSSSTVKFFILIDSLVISFTACLRTSAGEAAESEVVPSSCCRAAMLNCFPSTKTCVFFSIVFLSFPSAIVVGVVDVVLLAAPPPRLPHRFNNPPTRLGFRFRLDVVDWLIAAVSTVMVVYCDDEVDESSPSPSSSSPSKSSSLSPYSSSLSGYSSVPK